MKSLVLLPLLIAACTALSILPPNCKNFPGCTTYPVRCSADDEDCHTVSGSGSGSGSGDHDDEEDHPAHHEGSGFESMGTCWQNGVEMKLRCPPPTTASPTTTKKPFEPTPPPTKKPPAPETAEPTVRPNPPGPETKLPPRLPETDAPEPPSTDSHEPTRDVATHRPPKETPATTKPNSNNDPNNNKAQDASDSDSSNDKAWMIGVIVSCVIGSAILGVLAAIVVIKLKYSGGQNGSFHASQERGSTGSSSSQKPLYV